MKKIIFLCLIIIVTAKCYSQEPTPPKLLTKSQYLKKANNQKTVAWICLVSGPLMYLSARAIMPRNYSWDYDVNTRSEDHRANLAVIMFWSGFAGMIASVPFFLASKRNRLEARNALAFIKMEKNQDYFHQKPYPAISLKISLDNH